MSNLASALQQEAEPPIAAADAFGSAAASEVIAPTPTPVITPKHTAVTADAFGSADTAVAAAATTIPETATAEITSRRFLGTIEAKA
eukprot:4888636-Prorocentrum_lima.AAC.1